jgi:hypothetical protein
VLTSANQSYLIIGFKQPINCKKNVIWQMSKNRKITYVMNDLKLSYVYKQTNMDSYSKLSKTANFQISQIVTGKLRT